MHFEPVIGLEVHVELKTQSKMYSSAPNQYGSEPNTNLSVVDLGYPGTLPVVNRTAVDFGIRAALALNMEIADVTRFDRKNYFYPDNPKAYQISQDAFPVGQNGWLEIEIDGKKKRIGITRLHLEEDAGKSTHYGDHSLVDLNRQGTPLIEIVSEPDIRTPEEAYLYLEKLKSIIQYTGVSDVKMEEGSLRCDANLSLRPVGREEFGVKTELKNLNSFNYVRKGLEYEAVRQEKVYLSGGEIEQETRRYDEKTGETILMRVKEGSDDYRYFPEPDLVDIYIGDDWIEAIRSTMPILPDELYARYIDEYKLPEADARQITLNKEQADFLNEMVEAHGTDSKLSANWLMGEVTGTLRKERIALNDTGLTPENLSSMIQLIEDGTISSKQAKKVFMHLFKNGGEARQVIKDLGLEQISDPNVLLEIVTDVLDNNAQSIEDFKNGKDRAVGFLVGQIMKRTKGQANPKMVNEILLEEINKR